MYSTQQKAIHSKLFWTKCVYNFNIKICKILTSVKFLTEILQIKIGLSPELMTEIFEFIEKPYPLEINLQFRSENPNNKIWHRNKSKAQNLFQMNIKLSSSLWH